VDATATARPFALLPLSTDPADDPAGWAEAARPGVVPLLRLEATGALIPAIERMVARGARPLAQVSLGYATRPLAEILGEIAGWSALPIAGVFLDHAPAGPYQVGPVVYAVRAARRAGLRTIVLNPGVPVDPVYRRLDATICTFEGSWAQYRRWDGGTPGDGHLVYDVPAAAHEAAWTLGVARRAGLVLVSPGSVPSPLSAIPA
jgi:hypothetical protein